MESIVRIHEILSQLQGHRSPFSIQDFLVPHESKNCFLVKEEEGEASVLVFLQEDLLERMNKQKVPQDFSLEQLRDWSVVIEELSHFNLYCERALKDRGVSPLELEVQGEVDKFSFFLECLSTHEQEHLSDSVFEILFGTLKIGDWVESPDDRERYEEAHRIARHICRKLLEQTLTNEDRKEYFRSFFHKTPEQKLELKIK